MPRIASIVSSLDKIEAWSVVVVGEDAKLKLAVAVAVLLGDISGIR
jgi:hypothetical protein